MAFTYAKLTDITTIPASAGSVFTNPTNQTSYVRMIMIHNTNTTAEVVQVYDVPASGSMVGTASDVNKIYKETLNAGESRIIEFPVPGLMITTPNESIQASTTTAGKVNIFITGGKE